MLTQRPIASAPIGTSGNSAFHVDLVSGTFTLSMHGAAKLITNVKDTGVFTLDGRAITFTIALNVDANSGSFALTGQDVELRRGKVMIADSGSFTYTGQAIENQIAMNVDLASGTFTITDQDAAVTAQLNMDADSGTFTYTGQTISRLITEVVDAGSFTLTGQDVGTRIALNETLEAGSFSITGRDITFTVAINMIAESGTFVLTGQDIPKSISEVLESGTFTYTGQDISFKQGVFSGSFELTVGLSSVTVYGELIPSQNPNYTEITNSDDPNWQLVA